MRILIATPAGGGMVTTQYLLSFLGTMFSEERLRNQKQYDIGLYTLANESLIPRGRNHCAQVALTQGWDKLFFIDADAGWTWDNFKKIVDSPSPIIGGVCPLKIYPISLNYMPFKEDGDLFHPGGWKTVEGLRGMHAHYGKPEINVAFLGTAFMCIDRSVLMKLAETTAPYQYPNPYTANLETHWDFFKTAPVDEQYMSEDWGFCHLAREAGFDIKINPEVIITHTGSHTFNVANIPIGAPINPHAQSQELAPSGIKEGRDESEGYRETGI